MVFSERLVVAMESIHPQQLFPDVWLHCVQKCQRKGLLCTGMVLSRAGDIFGRQAGQKQITIPGGGESVMLVQGRCRHRAPTSRSLGGVLTGR